MIKKRTKTEILEIAEWLSHLSLEYTNKSFITKLPNKFSQKHTNVDDVKEFLHQNNLMLRVRSLRRPLEITEFFNCLHHSFDEYNNGVRIMKPMKN